MYDLIIVGGGPGGIAAGVYAERKRLRTLLLTDDIGGQSAVSADIQNWIGIPSMSGMEMAERLEDHLKKYAEGFLEYKTDVLVTKVERISDAPTFRVTTATGESYTTRAVIVVSGSRRRKLQVPGAEALEGKGIVYCASCDAPLFRGKDVAVIGGGNAGLETAQQLLAYATSITILEYAPAFRADPVTRERVFSNEKVKAVANAELLEVKGETFVTALTYKDRASGETHELPVQGIFVEIGSVPNSEMVKGLVEINPRGEIVIDHKTARTSLEGIWAAGDVTDQPYKQNNISMGDAVKALEDCYLWLQQRRE